MAITPKRPLLPREDRARLTRMADNVLRHRTETGGGQAYAQGVEDVLRWLVGDDMSPLLKEVTR